VYAILCDGGRCDDAD
jgi:hypothetical protein